MAKEDYDRDIAQMLSNSGYSDKAIHYFQTKKNIGVIEGADQMTDLTGPCGDTMKISLNIAGGKIDDAKIQVLGCPGAVASGCALINLAKGKTLEDALKIGRQDISNALDSLPPIKEHCSNLAAEALHEAIYDYLKKNNKPIPDELKKEHNRAEEDLETIKKRHSSS